MANEWTCESKSALAVAVVFGLLLFAVKGDFHVVARLGFPARREQPRDPGLDLRRACGGRRGLWVVFVHFSPTPDAKPPPVHAGEGSLAVGGNVSNSTIINGGTPLNAPTVEETSFFAECHYGTMPAVAPAGAAFSA